MSSPQVSVVIPNYNGAKYLRESIDSALNQQGVTVEIIAVDDGSTDNSREILESYGDMIRTFYQENKGAPAARNLGWRNAKAEFIKFLDSDDVLLEDVLKIQFDQIRELKENEIPYGPAIWTDQNLIPVKGYQILPIGEKQDPVEHILTQNPLTSSPLHRLELLDKVNGFEESLVKGQEFDLHLRLVLHGFRFIWFDFSIYCFRQSTNPDKISNVSIGSSHLKINRGFRKQEVAIRNYYSNRIPGFIRNVLTSRYIQYGKACMLERKPLGSLYFFLDFLRLKIYAR